MSEVFRVFVSFLLFYSSFSQQRRFDDQAKEFCQTPNRVSIAGSAASRMVQEGGRIVIICCILGNTSGHDHEQLIWSDPSGNSIVNYFSNAAQAAQSKKYAVPDFSDKNHIVSFFFIFNLLFSFSCFEQLNIVPALSLYKFVSLQYAVENMICIF